jgi:hypothetical protein
VSIELLSNTMFLFFAVWKAFDGKLHTLSLWLKQPILFTVACKAIAAELVSYCTFFHQTCIN